MVFEKNTFEVNGQFLFCCNFTNCPFYCFEYSDLLVHFPIHGKNFKAFECSDCPAKFATDEKLRLHTLKHLFLVEKKVKKFQCEICDRPLASLQSLTQHRRRHLYSCTICPRKFLYDSSRQVHLLQHYDPQLAKRRNISPSPQISLPTLEPETILGI